MNRVIVALVLLFQIFVPFVFSKGNDDILGKWTLKEVISVASCPPSEQAPPQKSYIGRKLDFQKEILRADGFKFLKKGVYKIKNISKKVIKYNIVNGNIEDDQYEACSLAYYDVKYAFIDKTIEIEAMISTGTKKRTLAMELGKGNVLAIFHCGTIYIFSKK